MLVLVYKEVAAGQVTNVNVTVNH